MPWGSRRAESYTLPIFPLPDLGLRLTDLSNVVF